VIDSHSGDIWAVTDWAQAQGFDDTRPVRFAVLAEEPIRSVRRRPIRRPGAGGGDSVVEVAAADEARTELVVTNAGEVPALLVLRFFGSSGTATETTSLIEAGRTLIFSDIAAAMGRAGAGGQVVIEPISGRVSAAVRHMRNTTASDGDGGMIGATVPVVSDSSGMRLGQFLVVPFIEDATRAHSEERLAGTRRTDVGLMESEGKPATVRISMRVHDGSRLASANVQRDFSIGPRETLYIRSISSAVIGPDRDSLFGDLKDLQLEFQVVGGEGAVTPFIVIFENGNGDARFRLE
jgi:hypothetical protein